MNTSTGFPAAPTQSSGFSLIELLIAMALMLALVLGAAQLLLYSIGSGNRCRESAAALETATLHLEELKAQPFDGPRLEPRESRETVTHPREPARFLLYTSITRPSGELKIIEIRCIPLNNPEKAVYVALYISRTLAF